MRKGKLTGREAARAAKLRTFIDRSSRTWLRPPYFDCYYITLFTLLGVLIFIGYLSTRIGQARRKYPGGDNPWFEANAFLTVIGLFFFPVSLWFCIAGWKRQATREKRTVKKMMYKELEKVVKSSKKSDRVQELEDELSRVKKENNNLYGTTVEIDSDDESKDQ